MEKPSPTLPEILGELDAGIFEQKVHEALKTVALGVIRTGKDGSIQLTLKLSQIGNSSTVDVAHTLKMVQPTINGKVTDESTTNTAMYANNLGYLTIHPQMQEDLFKESENVKPIRRGV